MLIFMTLGPVLPCKAHGWGSGKKTRLACISVKRVLWHPFVVNLQDVGSEPNKRAHSPQESYRSPRILPVGSANAARAAGLASV